MQSLCYDLMVKSKTDKEAWVWVNSTDLRTLRYYCTLLKGQYESVYIVEVIRKTIPSL